MTIVNTEVIPAGTLCIKENPNGNRQLFIPDTDVEYVSEDVHYIQAAFMYPFAETDPEISGCTIRNIRAIDNGGRFFRASDLDLKYILRNWPEESITQTPPTIKRWLSQVKTETNITKEESERLSDIAEEYL